ncbi:transposase domain-containing protein [Streptomyces sp. NPDC048350]|uniref:transposase domain-containing protein n=1 Tax=Streptomyces sp. NPDC048350 TaxID=3365538 RepID=UPI003719E0BF
MAGRGRVEQRSQLLPAMVVVYFALAIRLFSGEGYEEVARPLTQGWNSCAMEKPRWVPTTVPIGRARRLPGPEPLNGLFDRACRPVAAPETAGAWYRRWRLVTVDGTVCTSRTPMATVSSSAGPAQAGECIPAGQDG